MIFAFASSGATIANCKQERHEGVKAHPLVLLFDQVFRVQRRGENLPPPMVDPRRLPSDLASDLFKPVFDRAEVALQCLQQFYGGLEAFANLRRMVRRHRLTATDRFDFSIELFPLLDQRLQPPIRVGRSAADDVGERIDHQPQPAFGSDHPVLPRQRTVAHLRQTA